MQAFKVRIVERDLVRQVQLDPSWSVSDACRHIREKIPEANIGQPKDYGLLITSADDPKKGIWMDDQRPLSFYLVRSGHDLEYKKKQRNLRISMLDNSMQTMLIDDSQPVQQLMMVICQRNGILNHEEYSLARAGPAIQPVVPVKKSKSTKDIFETLTGTLGRSKEKKMDTLRKQLHTAEEEHRIFLDPSKTLREQGIDDNEPLFLRRKLYFSDPSANIKDPSQLNTLYLQCQNEILSGAIPVSEEEALWFAGLQAQIQFGDFMETKHKPGFLDLKEFLPKEYLKMRDAERRIGQEYWRRCAGFQDNNAKLQYTQRCLGLPVYGVTFFLVEEKVKGKNKLVPRLLGIKKDSVLRLDARTKEVLSTWPLEQVRRWAASPNTFTLDFGDYQDGYYSMKTNDGEAMAKLIAGYIDILLRKKKAKDHLGVEGDEGSTMLEDMVAPAKATLMSAGTLAGGRAPEETNIALPAILRTGVNEYGAIEGHVQTASMPDSAKQPKVYDTMGKSQRALVATVEETKQTVEKVDQDLKKQVKRQPEPWEPPFQESRKKVKENLATMGAATAEVVQQTAVPDRVDHAAVDTAISTINSQLPDMARNVRTVAAMLEPEDKGDKLLMAARKLCGAFSDLMTAVQPEELYSERQQVLLAAGRVGDYSHAMMQTMQEPTEEEKEFQHILVQLARAVATSTAQLVLKAKSVSNACEDQVQQEKVINAATQCAFNTSQLVATARVVAPTIDHPSCKEQLTDAAKVVAWAVEQLCYEAEMACKDERSVGDLRDAAAQVARNLDELLRHINAGPQYARQVPPMDDLIHRIREVAQATTYLASQISDEDLERMRQERLLAASVTSKQTGGATTSDDGVCKVSGIIGDTDITILFATAGMITPDWPADPAGAQRQAIRKVADALVEDTRALVAGEEPGRVEMAVGVQRVVEKIVQQTVHKAPGDISMRGMEAQIGGKRYEQYTAG